ncbi:SH3 domain-containing protein [Rhodophyticola porphyridii]|uniref:SH3 domain-containing protein n=1 Tax=Rhodophyticola porphyridii TaxID=1852017 RepID=UPI0035CF25F9
MIRLTVLLCATLYAGMIILPEALDPADRHDNASAGLTAGTAADSAAVDASVNLVAQGLLVPAAMTADEPATPEPMLMTASLNTTTDVPILSEPAPQPAMIIETANGERIEVDAVINPGLIDAPDVVSVAAATPVPVQSDAASPAAKEMVYVTGSRVNMRAGPSTQNPVLMALGYGAEAELIEEIPNGWVQIRHTESGRVGYMAGRFLSPDQP